MPFLSIGSISFLDPQQLSAVRRLQQIGQAIAQNNLRISTLKRINSAADDPAGLVAAENLQSEFDTLEVVSRGLSRADSLVDTAASAAGQIADQLIEARSLALAVAGGTLSSTEKAANQLQLDQILRSIDALSHTEFNGQRLLDGSASFRATGVNSTQFRDVSILDKQTASNVAVSVNVTTQATQASNSYTGGTLGGAATVIVFGPQGSAAVSLASGATTQDIADAFNSVSYLTGVNATKIDASRVDFKTADYGTAATMSFETTSGTFSLTTSGQVAGTNAVAVINGQTVTGDGSTFTVNTNGTSLVIAVAPTASGALTSFTVTGEGLAFVLGENPSSIARLGLPQLGAAHLNGVEGTLSSLASGGANSLTGSNVATAVRIIDNALDKVLSAEASLGSFQKYTLEASANVAASTQENVASALNDIAGTDVATETALLANNQLLQQATVQSLLMFNQQRQSLLTLLTSLAASV